MCHMLAEEVDAPGTGCHARDQSRHFLSPQTGLGRGHHHPCTLYLRNRVLVQDSQEDRPFFDEKAAWFFITVLIVAQTLEFSVSMVEMGKVKAVEIPSCEVVLPAMWGLVMVWRPLSRSFRLG